MALNVPYDKLVCYLIAHGKEGEYWDFKQEWHTEISDLIKDIVCFTNTVHDRDCYIIFGVSDELIVTGMKALRRKQADIIDAISNLQFAGDIYPQVEVNTVTIKGIEVDVLTVYNEHMTPVYLKKPYGQMNAGCIYSRIRDKNTPNKGNADFHSIENLWKKRFGLLRPPLPYIYDRIENKLEWERFDNFYYNIYKPEYVLEILEDDEDLDAEYYAYAMVNQHTSYEILNIKFNSTILETHQLVVLDSGRLTVPVPEWAFLELDDGKTLSYKYYEIGSNSEKFLRFFYDKYNSDQYYAMQNLLRVILIFESREERNQFENHVLSNKYLLKQQLEISDEFDYLEKDSKRAKMNLERLRLCSILTVWLNDWRKSNKCR